MFSHRLSPDQLHKHRFDVPLQPAHVRARANRVGRLTLWVVSAFLASMVAAAASSILWLFSPWRHDTWLIALQELALLSATLCAATVFVVLFILHRFLVPKRDAIHDPLDTARVHVALTAWNDEVCIADAVREFKAQACVHRVVVVENNSSDNTRAAAIVAGADRVVTEMRPGYGACCMRALAEAAEGADDHDVIVLCEGDLTFVADDVKKLLAYLDNCELVLGTRATQELRMARTQMDWLINPANQIVAKLIQVRFWGTRLTDVGCTYRALRVGTYRVLQPYLTVTGNHFSPHMFIEALKLRMRVIEIPVVFRSRAGMSKGVGSNKLKAARVAVRMLALLYRA